MPRSRPRLEARIVRWIAHGVGATRSTSRAVVHGACLTLVPSLALGGLLYGLLHALGIDPGPGAREGLTGAPAEWIGVVLVAPLLETLMMVGLLYVLRPLRTTLRIAGVGGGMGPAARRHRMGRVSQGVAVLRVLAGLPQASDAGLPGRVRGDGGRALHNAVLLAAAGVAR